MARLNKRENIVRFYDSLVIPKILQRKKRKQKESHEQIALIEETDRPSCLTH